MLQSYCSIYIGILVATLTSFIFLMRTKIERDRLNVMVSTNRLTKLRNLARQEEKSMTRLIEDWIDSLPSSNEYDLSNTQQVL